MTVLLNRFLLQIAGFFYGGHKHTQHSHHWHYSVRIDSSNYCFMSSGSVELTAAHWRPSLWNRPPSLCHLCPMFCRDSSFMCPQYIHTSLWFAESRRFVVTDSEQDLVLWFLAPFTFTEQRLKHCKMSSSVSAALTGWSLALLLMQVEFLCTPA